MVGYLRMGEMIDAGLLSKRSQVIATYALCGFSNFASIAIAIGGIGALAPERRSEVARAGAARDGGRLARVLPDRRDRGSAWCSERQPDSFLRRDGLSQMP